MKSMQKSTMKSMQKSTMKSMMKSMKTRQVVSTMCANACWWPRAATRHMCAVTATTTPRRMKWTAMQSKKWYALRATPDNRCPKHALTKVAAFGSPHTFAQCATFLMIALREITTTVTSAAYVVS